MGNQSNIGNNSIAKLCQFNVEEDPVDDMNAKTMKKLGKILAEK